MEQAALYWKITVYFLLEARSVGGIHTSLIKRGGNSSQLAANKLGEAGANTPQLAARKFIVMSTEWGISLSSTRIDEKSNEIQEMKKVMKQLDCRGCVVTADAMNTQKATAKAIIEEEQGDYCLALKENQKTAYLETKEYFACEELLKEIMAKEERYLKETEETTYNTVTREYFITDDLNWF